MLASFVSGYRRDRPSDPADLSSARNHLRFSCRYTVPFIRLNSPPTERGERRGSSRTTSACNSCSVAPGRSRSARASTSRSNPRGARAEEALCARFCGGDRGVRGSSISPPVAWKNAARKAAPASRRPASYASCRSACILAIRAWSTAPSPRRVDSVACKGDGGFGVFGQEE